MRSVSADRIYGTYHRLRWALFVIPDVNILSLLPFVLAQNVDRYIFFLFLFFALPLSFDYPSFTSNDFV
jgi:hypothetical protein